MHNSKLRIDLDALAHNYRLILEELPPGTQIMPMVKGNGYGLGAYELASFYTSLGVPFVGTSYAQEGAELREKGYREEIFTLTTPDPSLPFTHNLTVALHSFSQFEALHKEGEKRQQTLSVHLEIDTGLNRLGFSPQEALALLPFIEKSPWLALEGVMSHFREASAEQAAQFENYVQQMPPLKWVHMKSSKSLFSSLTPSANLVRIGALLFGSPTFGQIAFSLEAPIVAIRRCAKGEGIGYGNHYTLKKDALIATLAIGYHDGIPFQAAERGYVRIRGQKAPYIGTIYMDFMCVDITHIAAVEVGESAQIFGPQLPVEQVAQWAETNKRQLTTCIGPRVEREYAHLRQSVGACETHCAL